MDAREIRKDFPILEREVRGTRLVYLDNAATTQKPKAVIDALVHYYSYYNSNVHRAVYALSEEATSAYEGARRKVARFINAPTPECVIFTRNATEALNLVAYSWARWNIRPGDEILLTEMEHHSNLVPWQMVARERDAILRFIPVDTSSGKLVLDDLDDLITEKTRLVSVTHMSNVLGTINPVKELARRAHAVGALMVVDGAQSVPHLPVDVQELECDFLAFSGHKMLGPTGIGVLFGRYEVLEAMEPFLGGGDMIREVWLDRASWNQLPYKFEAGTPNIADAIALGVAVDYLEGIGMGAVRSHEVALTRYALDVLLGFGKEITIYGPQDPSERGGVISFNFADIHPHDLGTILDGEGVAIRAGHHCCQPLMRKLGVAATARASFYIYNLPEEVDALARALKRAKEIFGSVLI
jgi:cysteine desulfurase/selenocysteine lyase